MKTHRRTIRRCSLLVDLQSAASGARPRSLGGLEQLEARTVLSGFVGPIDHHERMEFEDVHQPYHEVVLAEGEYGPRLGGKVEPALPIMIDHSPRGGEVIDGESLVYRINSAPPPLAAATYGSLPALEAHPLTGGQQFVGVLPKLTAASDSSSTVAATGILSLRAPESFFQTRFESIVIVIPVQSAAASAPESRLPTSGSPANSYHGSDATGESGATAYSASHSLATEEADVGAARTAVMSGVVKAAGFTLIGGDDEVRTASAVQSASATLAQASNAADKSTADSDGLVELDASEGELFAKRRAGKAGDSDTAFTAGRQLAGSRARTNDHLWHLELDRLSAIDKFATTLVGGDDQGPGFQFSDEGGLIELLAEDVGRTLIDARPRFGAAAHGPAQSGARSELVASIGVYQALELASEQDSVPPSSARATADQPAAADEGVSAAE